MENTVNLETETIYPKLTPIVHPWVQDFLERKEDIFELMQNYGSPINVHNGLPFEENQAAFSKIFNKYQLRHKILFARKANKCKTFVEMAKSVKIGVDTASLRELQDCLDAGIPHKDIVLTAAVKTRKLLELAVNHNVLIVLDNYDELSLLEVICQGLDRTANVGIRLGGFEYEGRILKSRFGFSPKTAYSLVFEKIQNPFSNSLLHFKGFHFHLNGYCKKQRVEALRQTIALSDRLLSKGITTEFIDMGGGFLVNYLEEKNEWENFHVELKRAINGEREALTIGNDSLNMVCVNGIMPGKPRVYPFFNECAKEKFLEKILQFPYSKHELLCQALRSRNIEIRIEPGRSLLDQAGITMARICFRKKVGNDLFIGLEMNRTQLCSSSPDFLLDPLYVPMGPDNEKNACYGYLVGAYCLEQEFILKRKIKFPIYPAVGDILCFINTAGYMMHFYESQAHLFDLAKNLFASKTVDGWHYNVDTY